MDCSYQIPVKDKRIQVFYFEICGLFEPETRKEYQAEQVYIMSHMLPMTAKPRQVQFIGPVFSIGE